MALKTPLYSRHIAAGARMVDFGGWDMPLHYGSQIDEHHSVRQSAGVFDVSHMTIIDVTGTDSSRWLAYLLANDCGRLTAAGDGLYSCMLADDGGVIDDLIVYRLGADSFRLVVNAATREADLAWLQARRDGFAVQLRERAELAMLAVQGPAAQDACMPLLPPAIAGAVAELRRFKAVQAIDAGQEWFVARTGYTGEDGFELVLPPELAHELWDGLLAGGVQPCGLGARDTLRLEAGLNLYGQDMTLASTPLDSNLAWTVAWQPEDRNFIGRSALERQLEVGPTAELVGLVLEGRGIMRAGQAVTTCAGPGQVTSGGYSPTLERSIAFARVPVSAGSQCSVSIRQREIAARIVQPVFVRGGQARVAER
ncbi:MAG: glycine cleavage system aminomethyltransferase GcvT [Gammaproteobacteria bacterium]|nr:glycine cleavage system aminomethyltransferase GcvT [Gammaproteobacteria bacterium]